MRVLQSLVGIVAGIALVRAQVENSWPQDYPGKPSGDFSPAWQSYYQVNASLTNVTFPLQRNWAGSITVDRPSHPNDTLFFWAFEKQNGSFTAQSEEPWGIWLNGGPGSSSLMGLFFENGPIHVASNYTVFANNFSWNAIADYVWVDQPVGTGFSTADAAGYVDDEEQVGEDFLNFLTNLVKVFPNLKTRPLHITGESYAGTYIPYITKAIFGASNPPVNLSSIAIGDGTIGPGEVFEEIPTITTLETYPQLIGYDTQVFEYFKEQHHLCGYDLNLTYPQTGGHFPTLHPPFREGDGPLGSPQRSRRAVATKAVTALLKQDALAKRDSELSERDVERREAWKRDLAGRANGTIDPWYQCDLYFEMIDYALNFSAPWKGHTQAGFDFYQVPDALDPEANQDAGVFLNSDVVRAAIHAPTSKNWSESINYPFGSKNGGIDPSLAPMAFLTELATNASARGVRVLIYSGNDDSLVAHTGSEVVIQNTTFGGIQGFTRPPATPWTGDDGAFAGVVHQERNWTYVLVKGAGHLVPQQQPGRAFALARDFIFGNSTLGLVTNSTNGPAVVGGENATLAQPVMPGQDGIFVGSGATQSTFTYPSATIAQWKSFIATATASSGSFSALPTVSATGGSGSGGSGSGAKTGGVGRIGVSVLGVVGVVLGAVGVLV